MKRFCWSLLLGVMAAAARAADPSGLDSLDLRHLPRLRDGVAHLASSTDPDGGNDDRGHYRSRAGRRAVLLETAGPGQLTRLWSANPQGRLLIWMDDDTGPRLDLPFAELARVTGQTPRVEGFVSDAGGGVACWFPLPFRKFCRVAVEGAEQLYYQVNYTTYPAGTPVKTFAPGPYEAPDVGAYGDALEARGTVPPGGALTLFEAAGAKTIRRLSLSVSQPDGGALSAVEMSALELRLTWDDAPGPSVAAPLDAFFGTWFGAAPYLSAPMAAADWGFFTCDFPMPFQRRALGRLVNQGTTPVKVGAASYLTVGRRADDGYFHAAARSAKTVGGKPFRIAALRGRGHFVGTAVGLEGVRRLTYLEGDEQITVDGAHRLLGTGTEDYFDGAWFFRRGAFASPYAGSPVHQAGMRHVTAYRWHVADCIPYRRELTVDLEHGPGNDEPGAAYRATAYWYAAAPGAVRSSPPLAREQAFSEVSPVADIVEAEDFARLSSDSERLLAVSDDGLPMRASEGKVARYRPARADDALRVAFKLLNSNLYDLDLRVLSGTLETALRYRLDDGPVTPADASLVPVGPFLRLGRETLAAGPHVLELWLEAPDGRPRSLDVDFLRLTPIGKVRDAIEAESLPVRAAGGSAAVVVQTAADLPASARHEGNVSGGAVSIEPVWSGGGQVRFTPGAAGDSLSIPFEVGDDGAWGLAIGLTRGADFGACAVELDGRRLIDRVETHSDEAGPLLGQRLPLGVLTLRGGPHILRLVSLAGAAGVRPIGVDYLLLKLCPRAHEAEYLAPYAGFGGAVKERFGAEPKWGGGGYTRLTERTELRLAADRAGRYRLTFHPVLLPTGGDGRVTVDGQPASPVILACAGDAEAFGQPVSVELRLRRGANRLLVEPSGGDVGLDAIDLERLGGAGVPLPLAVAVAVVLLLALWRRRRRR